MWSAGAVNLDIPNKYIYDVFLMIYLSTFAAVVVVVFPYFGTSKDVIKDWKDLKSEIHRDYNSVIL